MIDEHGVVRHELVLAAPPEAVFPWFTDPTKLVRWIGVSADLDPVPGGRFRFEVAPGQYCEGAYVEVDPPRRLVLTWGWREPTLRVPPGSSRVEVLLAPTAEGGTLLRLVHVLPDDDDARLLHDDGWSRFLERLRDVASDGAAGEYPSGDPRARLRRLRGDRPGPLA